MPIPLTHPEMLPMVIRPVTTNENSKSGYGQLAGFAVDMASMQGMRHNLSVANQITEAEVLRGYISNSPLETAWRKLPEFIDVMYAAELEPDVESGLGFLALNEGRVAAEAIALFERNFHRQPARAVALEQRYLLASQNSLPQPPTETRPRLPRFVWLPGYRAAVRAREDWELQRREYLRAGKEHVMLTSNLSSWLGRGQRAGAAILRLMPQP